MTRVENGDKSNYMERDGEEVKKNSDDNFIDDETEFQDQGLSDYRLRNIIRDQQETLQDLSIGEDLSACSNPKNFVPDYFDNAEYEFDEFKNFEKRIKNFRDGLKIYREDSVDSFYKTILYGTFFKLCGGDKKEFLEDRTTVKDVVGKEFYEELFAKKDSLCLDLNLATFERQCHEINNLLIKKCLFLRIYKFKKKFRYLVREIRCRIRSSKVSPSTWRNNSTASR